MLTATNIKWERLNYWSKPKRVVGIGRAATKPCWNNTMAQEVMMVLTKDYDNLVTFYKGRITESTLLNKAGCLAAEQHLTLSDPKVSDSVALAVTKPKAREIGGLTKRIRSGGIVSSGDRHPQLQRMKMEMTCYSLSWKTNWTRF